MKKILLILLSLCLLLALCGCGDDEAEDLGIMPTPEEELKNADHLALNPETQAPQEEKEEIHLPAPPEDSVFYRGTWISGGEGNINDTLDHYYDDCIYNYMTLSPDGSGALVLGGKYSDFLYTRDGSTLSITLSSNGERFLASEISDKITEINYLNSGKLMTFIKLSPEDSQRVIKEMGLGK